LLLFGIMGQSCVDFPGRWGEMNRQKRFEHEIGVIEKQLEKDPQNPSLLRNISLAYFHTMHYREAAQYLLKVRTIEPMNPELRLYLGMALEELRLPSYAAIEYRRFLDFTSHTLFTAQIKAREQELRKLEDGKSLQVTGQLLPLRELERLASRLTFLPLEEGLRKDKNLRLGSIMNRNFVPPPESGTTSIDTNEPHEPPPSIGDPPIPVIIKGVFR